MESLTSDFRILMEKYGQELRDLQQRSAPPSVTAATTAPAEPPVETGEPRSFTAPLTVRVTAANEAIPVENALVTVTRTENGEIITEATRLTDQSGLTEPIILAAVDPSLTLQPGTVIPSLVHEVTVSAPQYFRMRISDIPLYGGIPTELPVALIPLPEFSDGNEDELQFNTPPIGL